LNDRKDDRQSRVPGHILGASYIKMNRRRRCSSADGYEVASAGVIYELTHARANMVMAWAGEQTNCPACDMPSCVRNE
jgi:hypothetical protein